MANEAALTPPALAKNLGINVHKILAWIKSGELRAVNLGNGNRPRWRILPDDLELFLARRAAQPAAKAARRQKKKQADVIEFF